MATIQWFPGHMAKAQREMDASLKLVDAVLELVDGRLPVASRNPMIAGLTNRKPHVVVMTRADLADPLQTDRWVRHFTDAGAWVVTVDAKAGTGIQRIIGALEHVMKDKRAKESARGIRPRPIRTMVVGIPNVGKSSLINRLAGRKVAKTGDRPGVTQAQQWIRVKSVELLDTPGVLWPKFDDERVAYTLAISGAIKSEILDTTDICSYFLLWCAKRYPNILETKLGLDDVAAVEWIDSSQAFAITGPWMDSIALRRGYLATGGRPDVERLAHTLLREVQTGALGRMTFEWPEELDTSLL